MTGNGIESDFVLPDSLFISDYSTLPAFYPHFGANCRFFCTISMSPDSSALFPSRTLPEALPLDSAKGSSTLWTPFRAIQLVTTAYNARVFIEGTQGSSSLDPFARLSCARLHTSSACLCRDFASAETIPLATPKPEYVSSLTPASAPRYATDALPARDA